MDYLGHSTRKLRLAARSRRTDTDRTHEANAGVRSTMQRAEPVSAVAGLRCHAVSLLADHGPHAAARAASAHVLGGRRRVLCDLGIPDYRKLAARPATA